MLPSLYLPPESQYGLTSPLGIYSGQFKITQTKDKEGNLESQATNLHNNIGLWSDKQSLYTSFPKSTQVLNHTLSEQEGKRAQVIQEANQPNKPGPLPLDLITSATRALAAGQ